MKIPRYWAHLEADLTVGDTVQRSHFTGHSDISERHALEEAHRQVEHVQARINEGHDHTTENYEVAIREEIVKELAPDAIVTRNRYGAEVLNCARLVMIDVDHAPAQGFWAQLLRRDRRTPKERMLDHIRKAAATAPGGLGFRIYETHNGYRVLVTGRPMAPKDPVVMRLFEAMHADPLYAMICRKQDCFRARLTPKPSRIRQKAIRLRFPYDQVTQAELQAWLPVYADRSRRYAVCKLIDVIGPDVSDNVVQYHDERTACRYPDPLA